jgi:hypothetical protein
MANFWFMSDRRATTPEHREWGVGGEILRDGCGLYFALVIGGITIISTIDHGDSQMSLLLAVRLATAPPTSTLGVLEPSLRATVCSGWWRR